MKSLYLAWQAPDRLWFPVGRLDADVAANHYVYQYTKGALQARDEAGFRPSPGFPELDQRYESSELFPLFRNRVLDPNRANFAEYLQSLDLQPGPYDPVAILEITGGKRQTDSFEVFPKIGKGENNSFACRFFIHGLRYVPEESRNRAALLSPGEHLGISVELTNPKTVNAIQLTTHDYYFVGWTPRYLVVDLIQAIAEKPDVTAKVVRVNQPGVPLNRRILVELAGKMPADYEPMSGEQFQTIFGTAH